MINLIAVIFFILIIVYGSGVNTVRSANLFFLYTFAGSLPMLLAILTIYSYVGSTDFILISISEINLEYQKILFFCFFLAFAFKTPLWPFHIWLPKAHSDSNLAGSIILAGTVLKFATYGFLRVVFNFLPDATHYFGPFVQTIAIVTLIYASLATIVQQDTKQLIAYSSVCHMAVVTLGLFSNTIIGIEGAILLAIAHGFVSPALFICVGGILYDRYHTRIVYYYRGLAITMPVFTILFFIFILANTGVPLTLNWLGEIMSLTGMFLRNPILSALGASGIVLSACYSIFLYNRISYGSFSPHLKITKDINRREFILLITLLIPTILLGIMPNVILDFLHFSVSHLLYEIPNLTPFSFDFESKKSILNCLSICLYKKNLNSKTKIYKNKNCKDIVIWGTNLSLTINFGFYSKQIREMIVLPYYHFSIIIGLYLSDGSSVLSYVRNLKSEVSKRNASFNFNQSLDKFYYFMSVFNILSHYCSKLPTCSIRKRKETKHIF
jgi:NADH-ubiquinone oxidoreductase chain 4